MASWSDQVGQGSFSQNAVDFTPLDINSPLFKIILNQTINNLILLLNQKTSGLYQFSETVDNNLWAPEPSAVSSTSALTPTQKVEFRKVFTMPALVDAGTVELLHGITFDATTTFVAIYGAATDPTTPQARGLGYASSTGNNAELWLDATKIYIRTTGAGWSTFTKVKVIVAFLKN